MFGRRPRFTTGLGSDGQVVYGSGVLPPNAFHRSSTSSSLNVDLNEVEMDVTGEIPTNGVINIQWTRRTYSGPLPM
jgi:hypothetical protein